MEYVLGVINHIYYILYEACERHVAELHDEQLFKDHPTPEECPICMLPMYFGLRTEFRICCGKTICDSDGCFTLWMIQSQTNAVEKGEDVKGKNEPCPFCRDSSGIADCHDNNAYSKRMKELIENDNAQACYYYGVDFSKGPQDWTKANELYLKAGDHGCAGGHYNLGVSYLHGCGVDQDIKKAKHYFELGAMNGHIKARRTLVLLENAAGNHDRASKHSIIGARAGHEDSLEGVKLDYMNGLVTKEEYANTLREYQKRQDETKSDVRDKAAESGLFLQAQG